MIVVVGSPWYAPPEAGGSDAVGGLAARVARAVAAAGGQVQLVGKIGDDVSGDALVLALGRERIGHAAILRDPAHPTPIVARGTSVAGSAVDGRSDDSAEGVTAELLAEAEPDDHEGRASPSADAGADELVLPENPEERPALEAADLQLALRYLGDFGVVVVAEPVGPDVAQVVAGAVTYAGAHLVMVVPPGTVGPAALEIGTLLEAPLADPEDAFATLVGRYAAALDRGSSPGEAFRDATAQAGWEPATTG